ncbi:MAG: alpha/beta hydrolase [Acidimicrobiia bacterium]|nr:alpha/beta hydrolase [Acidimicrobiia bacterium]
MPRASANGIDISYTDGGDGDPLVLVNGLGQPASSWELTLAPALRAEGFRVVTWDLRGTPPTSVPEPPYTVADMAADCIALVEAIGLAPAHLVGYSLGGWIVEEVGLHRPDLVRSAVMIGSANTHGAYERLRYPLMAELARRLDPYPGDLDVVDVLANYLPRKNLQDDATVEMWAGTLDAGPPPPREGRQGQWDAAVTWMDRDAEARWRRLDVDTLVLAFEHDVDSPPARAEAAAALMPRGRFEMIPDVGHLGVFERIDAVQAAITSFVRRPAP